ncbi:MAG: D-TA family PLP-dependent enzyme [SAR324 cluster bacterium]|nr:D-TA family PLP-dependent enzyme [SAR324 cluster bacterium]
MPNWSDVDTPAVLIDLEKVSANLLRVQGYADAHGLTLRPHIKTHKLHRFANLQVEFGACGITCQKVGEAESMSAGGIQDILITYNLVGEAKLERLAKLHESIQVGVVTDNETVAQGYANKFQNPKHRLRVLVECDTGAGRCGVQTPEEALKLARFIAGQPGLHFLGLMTYPPRNRVAEVDQWLEVARKLLTENHLAPEVISSGGTPNYYQAAEVKAVTEHRPGTYIYCDRMMASYGFGTLDDCALTVLATVVSRPTENRAVVDTGSKSLGSDRCDAPGMGHLVEYPDAIITTLNEEHGTIDLSACANKPAIGEKVRIIPNHVCLVSNLFDQVNLIRQNQLEATVPVNARGMVS